MTHMIACPECGQTLQAPDELIGTAVQCPKCQHAFTASAPAESAKPTAKEAEPVAANQAPEESEAKKEKRRARDDDSDEPNSRSIRMDEKPGHVTGMGIMALVGGIFAILLAVGLGAGTAGACCLWPGTYYSLVVGIMAVVRGSALLADNAHEQEPPRTLAILMIINIINGDITSFVLGIIMLTFCGEKDVIAYLKKPAPAA
jgi:DNA-directed RNA polymerase subunit M/transcription elongation factor TFIIS